MSDVEDNDSDSVPNAHPFSTRWTTAISISFFHAFDTILSDDVVDIITEAEFRLTLAEHMQRHHDIALDSSKIRQRLGEARKHATELAQQQDIVDGRHREWAQRRHAFETAQTARRQARASRAARRRPSQQAVDSDEEFDEAEPRVVQNDLQRAKAVAVAAYERVHTRFEAEKRRAQAERSEIVRVARARQRQSDRQRQLLSSLNAVQTDDSGDSASMDEASSAASSSSSPAKRRFNAAAVVGVYTDYCTSALVNQAALAEELRRQIQQQAADTAAYREKKLKAEAEYRAEKLKRMGGDKENRNPNTV